jgi:tight adherence protein C
VLEQVNAMLVDTLGPLGPVMMLGVLGFLLILLALPFALRKPAAEQTGTAEDAVREADDDIPFPASAPGQQQRLRSGGKADKLEKYKGFLEPQDAEELSTARLHMLQAGYRSKSAVRTFHAIQFALGLGFLLIGLIVVMIRSATGSVDMQSLLLTSLLPGLLGYYAPRYWVNKRRATRQQEIQDGFPDSLDMMLVCVEAGQSLDQSILRVAREIRPAFPALADEFEMVSQEVKAGKDRSQVLKDMSRRSGVADVGSFVTVLIQSATFGTSMSDALRVYAGEMRDKRVMRAEEKANVLPTKLTLGTMMFTVPPLLIILIGPSVHGIIETMGNMR